MKTLSRKIKVVVVKRTSSKLHRKRDAFQMSNFNSNNQKGGNNQRSMCSRQEVDKAPNIRLESITKQLKICIRNSIKAQTTSTSASTI